MMLYPSAVFMLNMSLMPDISLSLCHLFNSIKKVISGKSLKSLLLNLSIKLVPVLKLKPNTELLPTSANLRQIHTFVILNI